MNQLTTTTNTTKIRLVGGIAAVALALTACGGAQQSTDSGVGAELLAPIAEPSPPPAAPVSDTQVVDTPATETPASEAPAAPMPIVESVSAAPVFEPTEAAAVEPTPAVVEDADDGFDLGTSSATNAEAADQLIPASSPDFPCTEYVEATELPLLPCSKGELVVQLQHDLQWNGTPHAVDGYFGEDTYHALMGMQSAWGMHETGIMDQAMENVISYIYSH